mgnify:CR=1 FL=1
MLVTNKTEIKLSATGTLIIATRAITIAIFKHNDNAKQKAVIESYLKSK